MCEKYTDGSGRKKDDSLTRNIFKKKTKKYILRVEKKESLTGVSAR
jgi:hypothetical protein